MTHPTDERVYLRTYHGVQFDLDLARDNTLAGVDS